MKINKSRQYPLRDTPELMEILLKDQTTKKNIKWATDDYVEYNFTLTPEAEIDIEILTNGMRNYVQPRIKKDLDIQKIRTKEKAEVFTPTWIVKKQVEYVDEEFKNLSLIEYINTTWLEITCGEAPYICTRYDMTTGKPLQIENRVGFLDKKLQRINKEITNKEEWIDLVIKSYKTTYGYEYQGDSLVIARENLLFTFVDYYIEKYDQEPNIELLKQISNIISNNIIQMDGLNYTIPYSKTIKKKNQDLQLSLFDSLENLQEAKPDKVILNKKAKIIFNDKKINFEKLLERNNNMKFDVVIGNPPYQEKMEDTRDKPIYHYFINEAYLIANRAILITPGRFLFNAGATPKMWNNKMLSDPYLKVLYYNQNSQKIFPNNDIKGGIAITYRNKQVKEHPINIFIPFTELETIIRKVNTRKDFDSLTKISYINTGYRLSSKFHRDFPFYGEEISNKEFLTTNIFKRLQNIFLNDNQQKSDKGIRILGRTNTEGRVFKIVDEMYIDTVENHNFWKIFVAKSNGSGSFGEALSEIYLAKPGEGHTQTFMSFGKFKNEYEATNLQKYIKTKFSRSLLGVLKVTQDNPPAVWSNVPLQDFTNNSDIDWSKSIAEIDQQLYKKYGLDEEEIKFIEDNVKEME